MGKIRIVIADDHALLRAGLALLINKQSDMEVVGEAGTSSEAISLTLKHQPEVLALDLSMPGGSSIKAIETLREKCPGVKILVVTMYNDAAYLRAALAAGCGGYLVKTAGDTEMLQAIRSVAAGRTVINLPLSPDSVQTMIGAAPTKPEHPGLASLSQREREVLEQLARGLTNQQIADKLYLSVKTIETYRARICEKLGLKSRAEIVTYAMQVGLLDPGESGESLSPLS